MSMANVNNFISLSVHNIYRTIEVLHSVNIWKFIKPKCPSQIWKNNSQCWHQRSMKHYPCNFVFFGKIAGWTRTNASSEQNNIIRWNIKIFSKIQINSLNIIIQAFILRNSFICLPIPRIFVNYCINIYLFKEKWLKPGLN